MVGPTEDIMLNHWVKKWDDKAKRIKAISLLFSEEMGELSKLNSDIYKRCKQLGIDFNSLDLSNKKGLRG